MFNVLCSSHANTSCSTKGRQKIRCGTIPFFRCVLDPSFRTLDIIASKWLADFNFMFSVAGIDPCCPQVRTLDGRRVWRRRHYRVRRAEAPGTFRFSVLDNGVTSNEYWRPVFAPLAHTCFDLCRATVLRILNFLVLCCFGESLHSGIDSWDSLLQDIRRP